jgi:hypothetical protein
MAFEPLPSLTDHMHGIMYATIFVHVAKLNAHPQHKTPEEQRQLLIQYHNKLSTCPSDA